MGFQKIDKLLELLRLCLLIFKISSPAQEKWKDFKMRRN
jgi:hypothetical protein